MGCDMRLRTLLQGLPQKQILGPENPEVKGIAYDSRQVAPGYAFVAVRGYQQDGHAYIPQAVERGARVLILEEEAAAAPYPELCRVLVPDTRLALARIAAAFLRPPLGES